MPKPGASPAAKWTGTKGDDVVLVSNLSTFRSTTYDGAAGNDTLNLSQLASGVSLTLNLSSPGSSRLWADSPFHGSWWNYIGQPSGDVIENSVKNIERIVGTNHNDYFSVGGGTVARVVDGGGGDDAIQMGSSAGTNLLIGGLGSDQLLSSRNTDVLVGGTYVGTSAPGDDTHDVFTMGAGTVLDFELGVDSLYVDGALTTATWANVSTSYGTAARLIMAPDRVITLVGVDAAAMNATPLGYVLGPFTNHMVTSGSGNDFISGVYHPAGDQFIFPPGSGQDELVGFDTANDILVLAGTPTYSQLDYHGDPALLATYDGGASSVLLIGLDLADIPSIHVDPWG